MPDRKLQTAAVQAGLIETHERPTPRVPDHELIRRIGSGAYGEVWLAKNLFGTFRAIKVVYRDSFTDAGPYEREFRGIQKFEPISRSNEGLVDILQIGRNDSEGWFYYVMELADDATANLGGASSVEPHTCSAASGKPGTRRSSALRNDYTPKTLRTEIQQQARLPFEQSLQFAMSLTLALAHLHRHGLIHRDIKPSNIIFIGGIPKLADIGLVTEVEEARSFVGTEGFIPPEGPNSAQADIYSLGKVLYEMSMGKDRLDFPEPFTALGQTNDSQDLEELNVVILKACATDPRERYQTADEMHVDLALLQSGKSVKWKRIVEKRLAVVRKVAAVIAIIAALATAGYLYQRHQTREAKRLQRVAEDLAARMQIQNAEALLQRGESALGLAHLADVLRRQPDNRVAAERIAAVLSQRRFPRLAAPPLLHSNNIIAAHFTSNAQSVITVSAGGAVHFWNAQTGQELRPALRLPAPVAGAELNSDRSKIVATFQEGRASIIDVQTGALLLDLPKHEGPINAAVFSPNGQWIATASGSRVRCFSLESGKLICPLLEHAGTVTALASSPDSQWLASATDEDEVCIWNAEFAQLKLRLSANGRVRLLRFSDNGKWLAATALARNANDVKKDWLVHLWDIASGQLASPPLVHDHIKSIFFSPDSQRIVTADTDGYAKVWRVGSAEPLLRLGHSGAVNAATFSRDGRFIVTASTDHSARIWDALSGALVCEPMLHDGRLNHAEFGAAGNVTLTVGLEDRIVKLWRVPDARPTQISLAQTGWVVSAHLSPSGAEAITACAAVASSASGGTRWDIGEAQSVALWDVATATSKFAPPLPQAGEAIATRFTRVGPLSVVGQRKDNDEFYNTAQVWDLRTGSRLGPDIHHTEPITFADISADGLKIATASEDHIVTISFVGSSLKPVQTPPMQERLTIVRFDDSGRHLVTAAGNVAMAWDATSALPLAGPLRHDAPIWFAQFSRGGDRIVTTSRDYTGRVWSTNGALISVLRHTAPVEYADFSPDGEMVVTASGDRTARIWNSRTGQQLTEPLEHRDIVLMARFSPDGLRVITASVDNTAQLWDVATGLRLADPFVHEDDVMSAQFSADGKRVITASLDRTSKLWVVPITSMFSQHDLPRLAESTGRQRLNANRIAESIPWAQGHSLQKQ